MKKRFLALIALLSIFVYSYSQDENWEPQKKITGYIATEGEYFNNLKDYDRSWGVSLSEAGVLFNYQPTEAITFNSVIVYRPNFSIDQIINEASVEWKSDDFFKVKIGRFLTPISPMNTYYYAPVNNSVALPMVVSNHEFFPININGVSLNGSFGENFKIKYNVFSGGYYNSLWLKTGATGLFGSEGQYFNQMDSVVFSLNQGTFNSTMSFAAGGHIGVSFMDYVSLGFGIFKPTDEKMDITIKAIDPTNGQPIINPLTGEVVMMPLTLDLNRFAYGLNFKFKANNFQLLSEYWHHDLGYSNSSVNLKDTEKLIGIFIEASNTFNKLTPYLRYEYNDIIVKYERYTAGINYKPIFDVSFKLEYMIYTHNSYNLQGLVGSLIYSF